MKTMIISDHYDLLNFTSNYLQESNIPFEIFYTKKKSLVVPNSRYLNFKKINLKNLKKKFNKIISIHCHKILPNQLTKNFECINFHPGYNPYNRGIYPQIFSIINKKSCGVTIHKMTSKIDHGPIILRKKVIIDRTDTSYEVYKKIIRLQKKVIKEKLIKIIKNDFKYKKIEKIGNYNSIKKFKKICKLNLNSKKTLREHINLIRALSHGKYKNAYFISNKKKIFIKIKMHTE